MDLFGKAEEILQFDLCTVIQNHGAAHAAENLMLIADDELDIGQAGTVDDRQKVHFKAAIAGSELPRLGIAVCRNMKLYIIDLVRLSVIEDDIFRRRRCIAKSIADIKANRLAIYIPLPDPQYQ